MASQRISVFTFFAVVQILIALIVSSAGRIRRSIGRPGQVRSYAQLARIGNETFDDLAGQSPFSYDSNFGLEPQFRDINGTYTNLIIKNNDLYGGLIVEGNNGKYAVCYKDSGMKLRVRRNGRTGLSYFGLYWSSINYANRLEFLHQGVSVYNFTGVDAYKMVTRTRDGNVYYGNRHYGNWFYGRDNSHAYAFFGFEFFDLLYDEVIFGDNGDSGFESDNHFIGYHNNI